MQAQITEIRNKVDEVVALAESTYNIKLPKINVRFDLTGRAAGQAGCRQSFYSGPTDFQLRFNRQHIALGGQTYKHIVEDVVAHEVAHLVCFAHPALGRAHNPGWKRVCSALGGNGERCYSDNDAPEAIAKQSPYVYTTSNGHEVRVTANTHKKVQRGACYNFKRGKGSITSQSAYRYETSVVELATPSTPVVKAKPLTITPVKHTPKAAGISNADMIRNYIRNGNSFDACVEYGVNMLGMKRGLARTYVKNNWNKA